MNARISSTYERSKINSSELAGNAGWDVNSSSGVGEYLGFCCSSGVVVDGCVAVA